jgi:hypothetical protein
MTSVAEMSYCYRISGTCDGSAHTPRYLGDALLLLSFFKSLFLELSPSSLETTTTTTDPCQSYSKHKHLTIPIQSMNELLASNYNDLKKNMDRHQKGSFWVISTNNEMYTFYPYPDQILQKRQSLSKPENWQCNNTLESTFSARFFLTSPPRMNRIYIYPSFSSLFVTSF